MPNSANGEVFASTSYYTQQIDTASCILHSCNVNLLKIDNAKCITAARTKELECYSHNQYSKQYRHKNFIHNCRVKLKWEPTNLPSTHDQYVTHLPELQTLNTAIKC